MLEIFALCSCACLACLWCAVILELTKEKGSGKGLGNAFGRNCSTCSKDRRCTDCKRQFSRKSCNKNTRANNSYHKKHKMRDRVEIRGKDEEKRSCRCCHCSSPIVTSPEPPFTRSRSFPRLRPNRRAITVCKRACKICRRVKHGCAYARDNNFMHENPSSWHLCGHHSSCPNLTAQGQRGTDRRSPVRSSYHSLFHDPYQQSTNPNIWKDRRERFMQGRATLRRKRRFTRLKERRFY